MQKKLNRIAKDTNSFLKSFIKKQKKTELIIPMQYGLFSGGKKKTQFCDGSEKPKHESMIWQTIGVVHDPCDSVDHIK